ncbi:MAG: LamG-like jellyroll fold domain-containing protein, partial [Candidatus Aenigmatarchaeota archaeon]
SLGKVLLYKNGVLVSSTPRTIDNIYINNYNICIGCHYRYYHGWIDDVRLYNRALTPEEVKTLYEATR